MERSREWRATQRYAQVRALRVAHARSVQVDHAQRSTHTSAVIAHVASVNPQSRPVDCPPFPHKATVI
eukprot:3937041-Rhodomonas_salina.2